MKKLMMAVTTIFMFLTLNVQAKDYMIKKDLIVGVLHFQTNTPIKKVAEAAENLKGLDTNFKSLIVAEIDKNTYGIYLKYLSNNDINTPDKLGEKIKIFFKDLGAQYEGHTMSNSTIIVK